MLVKAMSILFMEKSARSNEVVILLQNAGSDVGPKNTRNRGGRHRLEMRPLGHEHADKRDDMQHYEKEDRWRQDREKFFLQLLE